MILSAPGRFINGNSGRADGIAAGCCQQRSGAGVPALNEAKQGETPARRASFMTFWQDHARNNPIEIARVSAPLLFTQHYSNYVEYFSKCLHYKYLYHLSPREFAAPTPTP